MHDDVRKAGLVARIVRVDVDGIEVAGAVGVHRHAMACDRAGA